MRKTRVSVSKSTSTATPIPRKSQPQEEPLPSPSPSSSALSVSSKGSVTDTEMEPTCPSYYPSTSEMVMVSPPPPVPPRPIPYHPGWSRMSNPNPIPYPYVDVGSPQKTMMEAEMALATGRAVQQMRPQNPLHALGSPRDICNAVLRFLTILFIVIFLGSIIWGIIRSIDHANSYAKSGNHHGRPSRLFGRSRNGTGWDLWRLFFWMKPLIELN